MCGRFVVARSLGELTTIFEVDEIIADPQRPINYPSFNVAPTHNIAMVVDRSFEKAADGSPIGELHREIHAARWGLVPRWSKGPNEGSPLINARIESILDKPSFKDSVLRRRTVIPASGYFEWHVNEDGTKQPFYINAGTDGLLALAGISEWWADPSKAATDPTRWLLSVSLITKNTAAELAHIHDRNPVLLSPETLDEWLDPNVVADNELLEAVARDSNRVAGEVEFHKVSTDVGKVSFNEPRLIEAL
jgi:putative SOS response-associated peptidase YedK